MSTKDFVVFLVDDDRAVLKAITRLLKTRGYPVRPYQSSRDFLSEHDASVSGCAVLDVSMPDLNGIELQERLVASGTERPIIFMTAFGDVSISVKAMRAGAVDFLLKPVKSTELFAAIAAARDRSELARERKSGLETINARLAKLTAREAEVLTGVVHGRLNKQIAGELGIALKTVKMHRGRMMRKMSVRTVAELVHLVDTPGLLRSEHAARA